jgi:hypothetical protein
MRHPSLLFTLPLLTMAAAFAPPSHAAPPQPPPPPTSPIPKVAIPKTALMAPKQIAKARRAGSETAYVSGPLALEVEVVNNATTALSTALLVGPAPGARVPVAVPANGRAWVGWSDPGLASGCEAKAIPVGFEGSEDRGTVTVQPTCTFQSALANAESQMTDDRIDDNRRGKLHITGARLTAPRIGCGFGIIGRANITNDAPAPATDVRLMYDGNRANVGTIPPRGRSEGSFTAVFDGRHGRYNLTLEGSGVPIWSPVWRVEVTRSCTLAVTLQR